MGGSEFAAWAVYVCILTIVALWLSFDQWHQSLDACAESIADYTAFCHKRCAVDLRQVRIGVMFVSVQSAVALTWLGTDFYWVRIPIHSFELAILILTGFSFAWGAFLFRTWRKVKREIRRMSVLQA